MHIVVINEQFEVSKDKLAEQEHELNVYDKDYLV